MRGMSRRFLEVSGEGDVDGRSDGLIRRFSAPVKYCVGAMIGSCPTADQWGLFHRWSHYPRFGQIVVLNFQGKLMVGAEWGQHDV